eukprot:CAMPEP_0170094050 /NCGR_PEP_ID=MMETSP0019_2-20121128/26956_1 /TAXON_ID=98059 /ORGANISM="Dinobryon sp., Strain UTEXLB2267" /LENGTH=50 /DNA_ID=CAMNT_0010315169 /DNA_START=16 /DNA_END=165 /DNA_ORIENTATION=-
MEGRMEGILVEITVGFDDGTTLTNNDGRLEGFFEGTFDGITVLEDDGRKV